MPVSYLTKAFNGIQVNIYLFRINNRNNRNPFMQLYEMRGVKGLRFPSIKKFFFPNKVRLKKLLASVLVQHSGRTA